MIQKFVYFSPRKLQRLLIIMIAITCCSCYTTDLYLNTDSLRSKPDGTDTSLSTTFGIMELGSAVQLRRHCPSGVSRVSMRQRFTDGMFHYMTFGFYSPQSVTVWCKRRKYEF